MFVYGYILEGRVQKQEAPLEVQLSSASKHDSPMSGVERVKRLVNVYMIVTLPSRSSSSLTQLGN